jgi:hypothetical protein
VALVRQITPPRALPGAVLNGERTFLGAVTRNAIARPTWGIFIIPGMEGDVNDSILISNPKNLSEK